MSLLDFEVISSMRYIIKNTGHIRVKIATTQGFNSVAH